MFWFKLINAELIHLGYVNFNTLYVLVQEMKKLVLFAVLVNFNTLYVLVQVQMKSSLQMREVISIHYMFWFKFSI